MRALLDVNVLLALLDADHSSHRVARSWLEANGSDGWASCVITENGFVRIISQPRYPSPITPAAAATLLARATATEHHDFWTCSVSILDGTAIDHSRLHGHRQVTDAYLLALAFTNGGRFVTLDRAINTDCVRGAGPEHLVNI